MTNSTPPRGPAAPADSAHASAASSPSRRSGSSAAGASSSGDDLSASTESSRVVRRSVDVHLPDASSESEPASEAPFRVVLDSAGVQRAATRLAHEILERNRDLRSLAPVAIAAGGVPVARLILDNIEQITGERLPLGELDVTLYRDDVVGRGKRPVPRRTRMLPTVAGLRVVLIDDVMFTGRTVRAAMDAVIDFGRPEAIQVACLVDRGHRELPIHIDFVGKNIPTQRSEQVSVIETSPNIFEVRVA